MYSQENVMAMFIFFLKRCELGSMLYLALGKMEDKYGQVLKRQWISAV